MAERQDDTGPGRRPGHEPAVRITTAAVSPREDFEARLRRYLWSMLIRTACVLGSVAVGPGVLRWVLLAGAVFLPWVAVVMANAVNRKRETFALPVTDAGIPRLEPGPDDEEEQK